MAKQYYDDLWKASFMLELQSPAGSEFYTFSLPPESIETIYPQRVSETKTFGGMFFDDYGSEAVRITLSGSTGNSELKMVYRGSQEAKWMTGKEEIYYIRDKIARYKDNSTEYDKIKMFLYNLSTVDFNKKEPGNYASDAWEVRLKDFKITQSKDRPFQYNYSVEFLGVRFLPSKKPTSVLARASFSYPAAMAKVNKSDALLSILSEPDLALAIASGGLTTDTVVEALVIAQESLGISIMGTIPEIEIPVEYASVEAVAIRESEEIPFEAKMVILASEGHAGYLSQEVVVRAVAVATKVSDAKAETKLSSERFGGVITDLEREAEVWKADIVNIKKGIAKLRKELNEYQKISTGLLDLIAKPYLQSADLIKSMYGLYSDVLSAPATFAMSVISTYKSIRKAITSIGSIVQSGLLPTYVAQRYAEVRDAYIAIISNASEELEENLDSLAVLFMKADASPDVLVLPDGTTTLAYGYDIEIATSSTTLEALAVKYFGDPDGALAIALCNGISGDSAITPGMVIKIPRSNRDAINMANQVFSLLGFDQQFGTDLVIQNGQIILGPGGDALTITGADSVNQAIKARLSESLGVRLRLAVYGIKQFIGHPFTAASSYVATSIQDTILQDPRILSIENFSFYGDGDAIYIDFDYTTKAGTSEHYSGGIR